MWKEIVLLFLAFTNCFCQSEDQVQYYKKLIQSNNKEAFKLKIPKDNRSFLGNKTELNKDPVDAGEYDFIVVGAGSTGTVVTRRLTENPNWTLLLIEAGSEENDYTDIPNELLYLEGLPFNWGYYTTPQKTAFLGMKNNQWNYPRGRVVGGSGTINALMYVRGNHLDYDMWANMGNPGWSYKDVLPYFKRSENLTVKGDPSFHGTNGPLQVTYTKPKHPMIDPFLKANRIYGIKEVDYNGKQQLGCSRVQNNIRHGRRESGGRVFLDPILDRKNLEIRLHCLVTRVLIDENKVATGVLFICDGILYKATVRKEVIISGGAINSPQLLMLSGIGPKNQLEKFNIPVIKDLPVGKHLRDHPTFFGLTIRTNYTYPMLSLDEQIKQYLNEKGLLTNAGNNQALGFIKVPTRHSPKGYPDIEYVLIPQISINSFSSIQYNFNNEIIENYLNKIQLQTDVRIYLALLHPYSHGKVTLVSDNPLDYPLIDLSLFSDKQQNDIKTMVAGIKAVLRLFRTKPFKAYNATLIYAPLPPCERYRYLSDKYWECCLRHITGTFYHPTGTTKMGPKGVVDHKLKVHGISNLRVADCGVIPLQPSGHTNAIAFMIGEKISDIIKQFYGE